MSQGRAPAGCGSGQHRRQEGPQISTLPTRAEQFQVTVMSPMLSKQKGQYITRQIQKTQKELLFENVSNISPIKIQCLVSD